jgi:hypothetical protein
VKETKPTESCLIASARVSWLQWSAVTRSSGAPAALNTVAKASAQSGDRGECLMTTELPARIAGMMQLMLVRRGKFQGAMQRTTPTGSFEKEGQ